MKLMMFKKRGEMHVKAVNAEYLFKHCANGESEVGLVEYKEAVEPLLFAHGVYMIEFIDEGKS